MHSYLVGAQFLILDMVCTFSYTHALCVFMVTMVDATNVQIGFHNIHGMIIKPQPSLSYCIYLDSFFPIGSAVTQLVMP